MNTEQKHVEVQDNVFTESEYSTIINELITKNPCVFKYVNTIEGYNPTEVIGDVDTRYEKQNIKQFESHLNRGNRRKAFDLILNKLGINRENLMRLKLNVKSSTKKHINTGWHTDVINPMDDIYTTILYLSENNGLTLIEDGQEIKTLNNRIVSFNANTIHAPITHTDGGYRTVLNIVHKYPIDVASTEIKG